MECVNPDSIRYGSQRENTLMTAQDEERGNVLIVDDDVEMLGVLHAFLEENGFAVSGALSARQALEFLRSESFDLLIADLNMPGMDGITLLHEAFQIDPDLVGIIMTGYGSIETAVEAMKAGAFDYLLKPFKFHMLMPICARAMRVRKLSLSERTYRALVDELTLKVQKTPTGGDHPEITDLEMVELKEEIERLNAELMNYKTMENQWMFYDA